MAKRIETANELDNHDPETSMIAKPGTVRFTRNHLAEAAPALLKALKQCEGHIYLAGDADLLAEVRAAIAKATLEPIEDATDE